MKSQILLKENFDDPLPEDLWESPVFPDRPAPSSSS